MPETRSVPLNNPSSSSSSFSQSKPEISEVDDERVKGVVKGTSGNTVFTLVRCCQCGKEQQVIFSYDHPSKYHRCVGCGESQPMEGFRLIAHANYPFV